MLSSNASGSVNPSSKDIVRDELEIGDLVCLKSTPTVMMTVTAREWEDEAIYGDEALLEDHLQAEWLNNNGEPQKIHAPWEAFRKF